MQTRPFYAHAVLGGKAVGRVFPMASHVGSTPSTTGYAWQERYNEKLGSLGTQIILTRLIPGQGCRYSPDDVHGSMPHLSQPCMYSARIFLTTLIVYYTKEELKAGTPYLVVGWVGDMSIFFMMEVTR